MACTTTCVQPSPSQAHCGSGCHRTFGSVSGFDRHRRAGQCLDPSTFTGHAAMHLDRNGIWRYDGGHRRAMAHAAHRGMPQAAESPSLVGADANGTPDGFQAISAGAYRDLVTGQSTVLIGHRDPEEQP